MFNILNHQRNTNQNNPEIPILLLSEWPRSKALMTTYAAEDVEKGEHSCIAGGSTSWEWKVECHFGNQYGDQDSAIPLLGIYPKDAQSYHKDKCSTIFIAVLFVIART